MYVSLFSSSSSVFQVGPLKMTGLLVIYSVFEDPGRAFYGFVFILLAGFFFKYQWLMWAFDRYKSTTFETIFRK